MKEIGKSSESQVHWKRSPFEIAPGKEIDINDLERAILNTTSTPEGASRSSLRESLAMIYAEQRGLSPDVKTLDAKVGNAIIRLKSLLIPHGLTITPRIVPTNAPPSDSLGRATHETTYFTTTIDEAAADNKGKPFSYDRGADNVLHARRQRMERGSGIKKPIPPEGVSESKQVLLTKDAIIVNTFSDLSPGVPITTTEILNRINNRLIESGIPPLRRFEIEGALSVASENGFPTRMRSDTIKRI